MAVPNSLKQIGTKIKNLNNYKVPDSNTNACGKI